ncbi:hypothetical protein ACR42A_03070 [Burkholderia gladioli]|nr:hypothetical protein [Burkholderia gladioli]
MKSRTAAQPAAESGKLLIRFARRFDRHAAWFVPAAAVIGIAMRGWLA